MSDIAITPADVIASAAVNIGRGTAGATITAGMALYADSTSNNSLKPAIATTAVAAAVVVGFALHASLTGQPIAYAISDPAFQFGGAATAGDVIYLGADNAGLVTQTFGDLVSGNASVVLGICNHGGAAGTATLNLAILPPVAIP